MGSDAGNQEEVGVAYKDEGRKPSLIASLRLDPYPSLEKKAPLALIYPSREDR
jgi:hypothetical protein